MTLVNPCLVAIAVALPLVALLRDHMGSVRFAERHHRHHDTFVVPAGLTSSIVLAMTVVSVLGLVLAWICVTGPVTTSPVAVLAFSDAFVATAFVLWWLLCRYKVAVFGDHMVITPFVGADIAVSYAQIDHMAWYGVRRGSGMRSLNVYVGGERVCRLSSLVDVERILMSVDRFDVLPSPA